MKKLKPKLIAFALNEASPALNPDYKALYERCLTAAPEDLDALSADLRLAGIPKALKHIKTSIVKGEMAQELIRLESAGQFLPADFTMPVIPAESRGTLIPKDITKRELQLKSLHITRGIKPEWFWSILLCNIDIVSKTLFKRLGPERTPIIIDALSELPQELYKKHGIAPILGFMLVVGKGLTPRKPQKYDEIFREEYNEDKLFIKECITNNLSTIEKSGWLPFLSVALPPPQEYLQYKINTCKERYLLRWSFEHLRQIFSSNDSKSLSEIGEELYLITIIHHAVCDKNSFYTKQCGANQVPFDIDQVSRLLRLARKIGPIPFQALFRFVYVDRERPFCQVLLSLEPHIHSRSDLDAFFDHLHKTLGFDTNSKYSHYNLDQLFNLTWLLDKLEIDPLNAVKMLSAFPNSFEEDLESLLTIKRTFGPRALSELAEVFFSKRLLKFEWVGHSGWAETPEGRKQRYSRAILATAIECLPFMDDINDFKRFCAMAIKEDKPSLQKYLSYEE